MYKDIITIFNQDKKTNSWYPTILAGVNVNMDRGAIVKQYGESTDDRAVLNVRFKKNNSIDSRWINNINGGSLYDGTSTVSVSDFETWDSASIKSETISTRPLTDRIEPMDINGGTFTDDGIDYDAGTFDEQTATTVTWIPPKEWARLANKTGFVTFAPGDFFWMGQWDGGSPVVDDNYGDRTFLGYMLQNYDFVYTVTSASYFTVIPHLEVTAK